MNKQQRIKTLEAWSTEYKEERLLWHCKLLGPKFEQSVIFCAGVTSLDIDWLDRDGDDLDNVLVIILLLHML